MQSNDIFSWIPKVPIGLQAKFLVKKNGLGTNMLQYDR